VPAPAVFWFRRDLRLRDHQALHAAVDEGRGRVLPLFVVDQRLTAPAGPTRIDFLRRSLDALNSDLGGTLTVRSGSPAAVVREAAREIGARVVVATRDFAPYGRERDAAVRDSLAADNIELRLIDSPYLVAPGTVVGDAGRPLKVFTAFRRRWENELSEETSELADSVDWVSLPSEGTSVLLSGASTKRPWYFGDLPTPVAPSPPLAGETHARQLVADFAGRVDAYDEIRNLPGRDETSRLSPYLKVGAIHPRHVLAACAGNSTGATVLRSELGWREFYADVLWHQPQSVRDELQPGLRRLAVDRDDAAVERFACWARGETGFPLVDAGMRQLAREGWMHNRVRMVAASFLVKHLHLDWRWGAKWFMWHLADGDVASNQHGWQWAAGTGTDAAPFHRIFNPTRQAERFDPDGTYVRRYVEELRDVAPPACWSPSGGTGLLAAPGYATAMIDLDTERREALARFAAAREAS